MDKDKDVQPHATAQTRPTGPWAAVRAAGLRPRAELETLLAGVPTTAIQNHLLAFLDLPESRRRGRPVVTPESTHELLSALGVSSGLAARLLTRRASQVQGSKDGTVELARIAEAIREADRGPESHSGEFLKRDQGALRSGELDPALAADFWLGLTDGRRYLTAAQIDAYVLGEPVFALGPLRFHKLGRLLSRLELQLLFDLAAQLTPAGERVLTEECFLAFLEGTLWRELAAARTAGQLYVPAPPRHESVRAVAEQIRRRGGPTGPAPALDRERSLAEQARPKGVVGILLRPWLDLVRWG